MILSTLPLEPSENQSFTIVLGDTQYFVEVSWIDAPNDEVGWVISLTDHETNAILFRNIPLVSGVDMLKQLSHLEIGHLFLSNILPPDYNALGNGVEVIYGSNE